MGTDPDMKKGFLAEALDLIGSGGLLPIQAIPLLRNTSLLLSIT
jgi:hypothetical protein